MKKKIMNKIDIYHKITIIIHKIKNKLLDRFVNICFFKYFHFGCIFYYKYNNHDLSKYFILGKTYKTYSISCLENTNLDFFPLHLHFLQSAKYLLYCIRYCIYFYEFG